MTQLAGQALGLGRRARSGPPHVVGVVSGRGGSGVSLVSALFAVRSALAGLRTLLVDADPWLDMQRVWLGLPRGPRLEEMRSDSSGVESLVTTVSGKLELLCCGGGEGLGRDRRALVRRVASAFPSRDAVVIDAGSRLESLERCADLRVGSLLVVSGADAISLASTHALLKAIHARLEAPASVVFNRIGEPETRAAEAVLAEGARRFLGITPVVVGALPADTGFEARLSGGQTLPESLVGSSLTEKAAHPMRLLQPWLAT